MKFLVVSTSGRYEKYQDDYLVEINSLDELLGFAADVRQDIIISKCFFAKEKALADWKIEIYDDYRE